MSDPSMPPACEDNLVFPRLFLLGHTPSSTLPRLAYANRGVRLFKPWGGRPIVVGATQPTSHINHDMTPVFRRNHPGQECLANAISANYISPLQFFPSVNEWSAIHPRDALLL